MTSDDMRLCAHVLDQHVIKAERVGKWNVIVDAAELNQASLNMIDAAREIDKLEAIVKRLERKQDVILSSPWRKCWHAIMWAFQGRWIAGWSLILILNS